MAKNRVLPSGREITVALANQVSGDPVAVGQLTGVALNSTNADGKVTVDTDGVYDLAVKGVDGSGSSAVAVGDAIYYVDADTPKLSKKATGIPFGIALEAVAGNATTTIQVRLGKF